MGIRSRFRSNLLTALGLLVTGGTLFAQSPPWQAVEFFDLTGGLNDAADRTQLKNNEARDLQNVVFTTFGAITKRDGFTEINPTAIGASATATGLAFYRQADGDRFLVGTWSNGATDTIQKMDYGAGTTGPDGTWDDVTGGLSLSFTDDQLADFATAEDSLIIVDGVNTTAPYILSGNAGQVYPLAGSPPNATMVEYHKRILWTAGLSTARSRVTFSNLDAITTWTGTDTIEVETNDGQVITALKSALDCLYVFKTDSIWRICGTNRDDLTLEQQVEGIGAVNNQSVVLINNQFVFMTSQGDIAVYDGGVRVEIISAKIEGTLTGLNIDRLDNAVALAFDDGTGDEDYYLCVSNSGSATNNRVLLYDTLHQAWTKFAGINCNAMTIYEIGTIQRAIAFANYAGQAFRYPDTNADDGAAINAYYVTGDLALGLPQQKVFRLLQPIVQQEAGSTTITFEPRIDFAGSGTQSQISLAGSGAQWDSAQFDTDVYADLLTTMGNIHIDQVGNFIAVYFENTQASQPFLVRGWKLWSENTGRIE